MVKDHSTAEAQSGRNGLLWAGRWLRLETERHGLQHRRSGERFRSVLPSQRAIHRCAAGCVRAAVAGSAELPVEYEHVPALSHRKRDETADERGTGTELICVARSCHAALLAMRSCRLPLRLLRRAVTQPGNNRCRAIEFAYRAPLQIFRRCLTTPSAIFSA
jgi:hypothetical protein